MFYEVDKNLEYEYTFILATPKGEKIDIIDQTFLSAATYNPKFPTTSELDLEILKEFKSEFEDGSGIKKSNEIYDQIKGDYQIIMERRIGDELISEDYFIIISAPTSADRSSTSKSVKALSREYELNKKIIRDYEEVSRSLYSMTTFGQPEMDENGRHRGILNYLSTLTSWEFDFSAFDDKFQYAVGADRPYRGFAANGKTLLSFLAEDVTDAFDAVFIFDTKNKRIIAKDLKAIGVNKGLYISDRNFLQSINVKNDHDEIATVVYGQGADGVTIHSINPSGQGFVENYSFYKENYMSDELKDALDALQTKIESQSSAYQAEMQALSAKRQEWSDIDAILNLGFGEGEDYQEALRTQLSVAKQGRDLLISAEKANADDPEYQEILGTIETVKAQIAQKESELDQVQSEIDDIMDNISELAWQVSKENPVNNFIGDSFNLLPELDYYTRERLYNNTSFETPEDLLEKMKEVAIVAGQPPIEIQSSVMDFLSVLEYQHEWEKLELGDGVYLETEEFEFNATLRLVGYTHDILNKTLTLNLSNKSHLDDPTIEFSDILSKSITTSTTVDLSKYKWDQGPDNAAAIEELRNSEIDAARNRIVAGANQNVVFDETGLLLASVDPNEAGKELKMINNTIAFTENSWDTAALAITPKGLFAKAVYGDLIAGGNLTIENASKTFRLDGGQLPWAEDMLIGETGSQESITQKFNVMDGEFRSTITRIEGDIEAVRTHYVYFTNENQSILTDSNGVTQSTLVLKSFITLYKGTERVSANITSAIARDSAGNVINLGTIEKVNPTEIYSGYVEWTIPSGTNLPTDFGEIHVEVVAENETYERSISWTKAKTGPRGLDGLDGEKGDQGIAGPPGEDGVSSYTHIAYADSSDGSQGFDPANSLNKKYIGIYVDQEPQSSSNPSDYNWTLIKGADGEQGIPGPEGEDGLTSYFHTAWANTADGSSGFSTTVSENKLYLGTYTDFVQTSSTSPSSYNWTRIKGDKGEDGAEGNGIENIIEYYLATSASSGVTKSTSGWTTTIQTMTETNRYLWNYERIEYTNGTFMETDPMIIGTRGESGSDGSPGRSIAGITEYYLRSSQSSGITRSTSGWSTTMQTPTATLKYLWNYEKIDYINPTGTEYIEPRIIGAHGDTGPKGDEGAQGVPGPPGEDGQVLYTWVKYADTPTSGISNSPTGKKYIGLAYNKTSPNESNTYSDYSWALIKGEDGVPGSPGADGQTTYTWVRYADTETGDGISGSPVDKRYLGLAHNKTTSTPSNNASDYSWSPLFDNVKVGVRNLLVRHNEQMETYINTAGTIQSGGATYQKTALSTHYIEITPGEIYTFSKNTAELDDFWRYRWFDENMEYMNRRADNANLFQWTAPSGAYFLQASYPAEAFPKIEKGNIPTGWTEAPEDALAREQALQQRVTTTETELLQTTNSIGLLVQKSNNVDGIITAAGVMAAINDDTSSVVIAGDKIQISGATTFASGYDPTTKETPAGAQSKANSAQSNAISTASADATSKANAAQANAIKYTDESTGNLVDNPTAGDGIGRWSGSGLSVTNQSFDGISVPVLQSSTSSNIQNYSGWFNVDTSKAYEVSLWIKKSAAQGLVYIGLNGRTESNATSGFRQVLNTSGSTGSVNTNFYFNSGNAPTDWVKIVGYIMPAGTDGSDMENIGILPLSGTPYNCIFTPETRSVRLRFLNWNNSSVNQVWVANPKIQEVDPLSVIKAAKSERLASSWQWGNTTEIDGGNIRTRTITADKIGVNSITAASGVIADAAITSAKIVSLDANKINANTLSAISANLGTINAGNINGVNITGSNITAQEGSFYLQDSVSSDPYSIVPKSNLIVDHSFERIPSTGSVAGDGTVAADSASVVETYTRWRPVGSPRLIKSWGTDGFARVFGMQTAVVNNANYYTQTLGYLTPGQTYTLSAHFFHTSRSTSAQPRLLGQLFALGGSSALQTVSQAFTTLSASNGSLRRHSVTFTVPTSAPVDNVFTIRACSNSSGWIGIDGMQLVEGSSPVLYDPEDTAFLMQGEPGGDMIVANGLNLVNATQGLASNNALYFGGRNSHYVGVQSTGEFTFYGNRSMGSPFMVRSHSNGGSFRSDFYISDQGTIYTPPTFTNTTTLSPTLRVGTSAGHITSTVSSRKHKLCIEDITDRIDPYKIIGLARSWYDKGDSERLANALTKKANGEPYDMSSVEHIKRIPGFIAEEMADAGLEMFVDYEENGEIKSVLYDRIPALLVPIIGDLLDRIKKLEELQ